MKIAKVEIENFRHIDNLSISLTDSMGQARNMFLIAGPNGSGKTSILDAIGLVLGPSLEWNVVRPSLGLRQIARPGRQTKVKLTVQFADDELAAIAALRKMVDSKDNLSLRNEVTATWMYPSLERPEGIVKYGPTDDCWKLFKGRHILIRYRDVIRGSLSNWFERVGAAFTFDQRREVFNKLLSPEVARVIRPELGDSDQRQFRTSDPRDILISEGLRSAIANGDSKWSRFDQIKMRFAEVSDNSSIVGVAFGEDERPDIVFARGNSQFRYDDLSSGEQMVLNYLIKLVSDQVNRSVIMIDEVELHLHPTWQLQLMHALPKAGIDNQFIVTTHSDYLRDSVSPDAVFELGKLR